MSERLRGCVGSCSIESLAKVRNTPCSGASKGTLNHKEPARGHGAYVVQVNRSWSTEYSVHNALSPWNGKSILDSTRFICYAHPKKEADDEEGVARSR